MRNQYFVGLVRNRMPNRWTILAAHVASQASEAEQQQPSPLEIAGQAAASEQRRARAAQKMMRERRSMRVRSSSSKWQQCSAHFISSRWQQDAKWSARNAPEKCLCTPKCCTIGGAQWQNFPLKGVRNPHAMHSNNCWKPGHAMVTRIWW